MTAYQASEENSMNQGQAIGTGRRHWLKRLAGAAATILAAAPAYASEANLVLPDLSQVNFLGVPGHTLLMYGIGVCVLGMIFGLGMFMNLRNLPVHRAMKEVS
jgi:K(+)-stimulated pyrophosphate-energized sodium pump